MHVDKAGATCALVHVFGGEQEATHMVGGMKWWQVRPGDQGYIHILLAYVGGAEGV